MPQEKRILEGNFRREGIFESNKGPGLRSRGEMSLVDTWKMQGYEVQLTDPTPTEAKTVDQLKDSGFVGVVLVREIAEVTEQHLQ